MKKRCYWCEGGDENYIRYHDEEWGVPVHDDLKLFEFMVLESAQAGLSWRTILRKREGYRRLFKNFNPKRVAMMTEDEVEQLMVDASIVRNRLKIRATIQNAQRFLEVQKEFGTFNTYLQGWQKNQGTKDQRRKTMSTIPVTTPLSDAISNDLKKRGFKFLGSTIWYAYMQAVGMVNDHTDDCFRQRECMMLV